MTHSTTGLPVHHQLLGFTLTHVHWIGDAIQPSHPLSSPTPALKFSQHQGLFQWVSSSHQVAKILELQLQHQFFQWIFRADFLYNWLVWSQIFNPGHPHCRQILYHLSRQGSPWILEWVAYLLSRRSFQSRKGSLPAELPGKPPHTGRGREKAVFPFFYQVYSL